jgi:hypothetical protein
MAMGGDGERLDGSSNLTANHLTLLLQAPKNGYNHGYWSTFEMCPDTGCGGLRNYS